jgi:hypothetical protein
VFILHLGDFLMNGWMWRLAEAEAIIRQAPRAKGGAEPGFLPGCFLHDSLCVCTCMCAFDVVSFTVKA